MRRQLIICTSFSIILGFILAGCVSTPVKQVKVNEVLVIPIGHDAIPIQFKKVVVKLPRGKHIGNLQGGLACVNHEPLIWKGGRVTITSEDVFAVFREEFQKANYPIVGDPNALFEDTSEWKAELLVAGLVNDVQANICYPMMGFGNFRDAKGEAYVKVEWHIYSRLDRKVVYKTTTEGSNIIQKPTP